MPTAATGCSQAIVGADRTWSELPMSSRAHISRRDRLLGEIGMLKGMRTVRVTTVASDEVYAAVGKVIVDAAFVDWSAAQLVAAVNGEDRFYEEASRLLGGRDGSLLFNRGLSRHSET